MAGFIEQGPIMNPINAIRRLSLLLLFAASMIGVPAYAQISVNINIAPPAPQYEVAPAVPPGYVWAPGYWGWNGDRYVWVRGRTIVQREGYRWEPDRWDHRDRTYYRTGGHWVRDHSYKPVKMKKEKKEKKEKKQKDHGNKGKHGKGGKHGD